MTLTQVFIRNMKEFRKKEGISQMKLAEYLNASSTYIGEIEVGKKFPSMDMIEKIAAVLKIEPYHFLIDRTAKNTENAYPKLPKSMQNEIKSELNFSINELIRETLEKY
jgi:transcriptional regulator with XRE-family HTH domain